MKNFNKRKKITGLIHCFSSTKKVAEAALDIGFYISLSGIITFKNATEIVDIVKYIPANRLLVETDSPYLSPVPFRGKEMNHLTQNLLLKNYQKLKISPVDKMAKITTENFFRLFEGL